MTAPKKPSRAKVPVGVVPHATHAELTGATGPVRGGRVLYTNRLGLGPWPGVIADARVSVGGEPGCWLRVTKPNGTEFFTAAVMGDGPDQFTLAD